MNIFESARLVLEGKPPIPTLDLSMLKSELRRIQSLFDQANRGAFKISTKYKVEKDGHLSIPIDIKGNDDYSGYIEFTSEVGGYDDQVSLGIDANNAFEKYTYSVKELKKINASHIKQFMKLAKDYED